ncbi:hypothetical protein EZS27_043337 [termite gut metagenome]|uniref:Uncharacterized protein n=1 Tax=termite gut metagenome TaxID=433724 RepID=A0A5J4P8H0_9ZZZZ
MLLELISLKRIVADSPTPVGDTPKLVESRKWGVESWIEYRGTEAQSILCGKGEGEGGVILFVGMHSFFL